VSTVHEVRVRNASNTYTATLPGQRSTPTCGAITTTRASCTSGPEHAARALARKLFGDQPATLEFVSRDGRDEVWRISA
jgi:hypothetical protein